MVLSRNVVKRLNKIYPFLFSVIIFALKFRLLFLLFAVFKIVMNRGELTM